MKALEAAKIAEEVRASRDLSEDTKQHLLGQLSEIRLAQGNRRLTVARYVNNAILDGLSPAYAIKTAAALYHFDPKTVREICDECRTCFGENSFPPLTQSA